MKSKLGLPIILIITILLALFVFQGFGQTPAFITKLNLGLDIEGGVSVVYEAKQGELSNDEFDTLMNQTRSVLSRRIDSFGLAEPNITREGEDRIRIELPGANNVEAALETIGKTAVLEFYQVDEDVPVMAGYSKETIKGKLLFTGKEISDSFVSQDKNGRPAVALKLTDASRGIFAEVSKDIVQNYTSKQGQIAIVLDNQIISAPRVSTILDTKDIIIEGNFTLDEAKILADLIKGGALPLELHEIKTSMVNATLGRNALDKSIEAALIGLSITILTMLIVYRLPGLMASIALMLYASLLFFFLVIMDATLTLPGMAGMVLSIGMAVDANIIVFEGLHEELSIRKNIGSSIKFAFQNTSKAIIDSNVTTLIAAVVLYYFGEGSIRGFAITLMVGILLSMFTAIIITRILLYSSSSYKGLAKLGLFGYKPQKERKIIAFSKHRKVYNIISIAIIVGGLIMFAVTGFNFGIDFQGGTRMSVEFTEKVTAEEIQTSLENFNLSEKVSFSAENDKIVTIKTKESLDNEQRLAVFDQLKKDFSLENSAYLEGEQFGASIGKEITNNAILSIAIAAIGMLLYVWIRFQFLYGAVSILALLHDVAIMLSVYLFTQVVVNSSFIAAILTIVGYSINDTIVIFDKLRTNHGKLRGRNFDELADLSATQTLKRTILSSLTTFITIGALFVFGSESLREFALPLMAGVIIGTYSSIFIAPPIWGYIRNRMKVS